MRLNLQLLRTSTLFKIFALLNMINVCFEFGANFAIGGSILNFFIIHVYVMTI